MDPHPVTSSAVEIDVSEDERNDNETDNEEFEEEDNDVYPDFDAHPPSWSANTNGLKQIPFTKREGLQVPNPGNRPIDFILLLLDIIFLEKIVKKTNQYTP